PSVSVTAAQASVLWPSSIRPWLVPSCESGATDPRTPRLTIRRATGGFPDRENSDDRNSAGKPAGSLGGHRGGGNQDRTGRQPERESRVDGCRADTRVGRRRTPEPAQVPQCGSSGL